MNGQIEKDKIQFVSIDDLELDKENPRIPLSVKKSAQTADKIINYLLRDASLIELMLSIGTNGFFVGEALLVVKNEKKYTVIEGNRRLASSILLSYPEKASIHKIKIDKVLSETTERPSKIPCLVFENRKKILQYLGFRHITGIKPWSLVSKARYLHEMHETLRFNDLNESARNIAKRIGSRSDYVKRILVSYSIYLRIEDEEFYDIPNLDDTTFHFNYIADSLLKENIRNFIEIDLSSDQPVSEINAKCLKELIDWFFRKNEVNKSRVLGNSHQLGLLDNVLSSDKSLKHFREGATIYEAQRYIKQSSETFHSDINESLNVLKRAQSYIHNIDEHFETDVNILKEISKLCRTMRDSILGKEDGWD